MMVLQAEVIAIGDELTSGQRLDTNSQWLSLRLGEIGVSVSYHTTVGDGLAELTSALQVASARVPLVVLSGGLGPTADDLTRQALADAAGRPLEFWPEAFREIESRFIQRGRPMPAQNRVQAMFPAGSQMIRNPHGTAPGIDLTLPTDHGSVRLFALPGVPAEMKEMWFDAVQPAIIALTGAPRVICHHRVKCFGAGESQLEAMLPDLINRDRVPRVGITVHQATITLRVTASGPDVASCHAQMAPTLKLIRDCLGELAFGEEDDELEHVVLRGLHQRQQTLAVCEWGTAGLLARWLSAGAPTDPLAAALVVTSDAALTRLLGPPPAAAMASPSDRVGWMAEAIRRQLGTDYALAVGPRPEIGTLKPRIQLALATPQGTRVVERAYAAHPDVVLELAAKQALDLLRLELAASLQSITIQDPTSGTAARILVGGGFNCYQFRAALADRQVDVIWSTPGFEAGGHRPSGSGIPILFPFPGRIQAGRFAWQGREFQLPDNDGRGNAIHGFVHDRPWRVIEQSEQQVTGQFQASIDDPSLLQQWPSDFRITATYRVIGSELQARYLIENPGPEPLPCGFGTHPYFCVPLGSRGSSAACQLVLPVTRQWVLQDMNATGEQLAVANAAVMQQGLTLGSQAFDHVFTGLVPAVGPRRAQVVDAENRLQVTLEFDAPFRECVVYTPDHRQAVCIEPYTCVPDPFRLEATGHDAGLMVVAPGASVQLGMTIRVAPIDEQAAT